MTTKIIEPPLPRKAVTYYIIDGREVEEDEYLRIKASMEPKKSEVPKK
jgi:hypothetical protein